MPPHLAYALGGLGLTLPAQTFGTYLAFYYLDRRAPSPWPGSSSPCGTR